MTRAQLLRATVTLSATGLLLWAQRNQGVETVLTYIMLWQAYTVFQTSMIIPGGALVIGREVG